MNRAETIAEAWITKEMGEKPIFQRAKSPDFILGKESYEVKPGYKDKHSVVHINLRRGQIEALRESYPGCKVLVVMDGDVSKYALPTYESQPQKLNDRLIIHWLGENGPKRNQVDTVIKLLSNQGMNSLPKEIWKDTSIPLTRQKVVALGLRALQYLVERNTK